MKNLKESLSQLLSRLLSHRFAKASGLLALVAVVLLIGGTAYASFGGGVRQR